MLMQHSLHQNLWPAALQFQSRVALQHLPYHRVQPSICNKTSHTAVTDATTNSLEHSNPLQALLPHKGFGFPLPGNEASTARSAEASISAWTLGSRHKEPLCRKLDFPILHKALTGGLEAPFGAAHKSMLSW